MESAVMTEVAPTEKLKHTHPSNFGRFVEGCPRCIQRAAGPDIDPLPRRNTKRAPNVLMEEKLAEMKKALRDEIRAELLAASVPQAEAAPIVEAPAVAVAGITPEALTDAMRALGTELRRPDPLVEQEREAAKLRMEMAKENERQVIAEQARIREAEQNACDHKMQNGVSSIRGQVHNDGLYHPFCVWCLKAFEPRVLSQSERSAMGM